ncbi:proclotting enzyme-like [Asbolus verrucosus]|uniref:Proclotting enzyme-like n=1 Tax=Asbolus verrucosus TaxID=1661398 RepID=A0A482WBP1_ASBVE|nr:proclotting enzyme-like [Asbolus verrucosus]
MSVGGAVLAAGLLMTLGSITSALNSPCPHLFHYDSTDQPGQWTGTVTLLSDVELHGVWIRLIFDEKLTELDVGPQLRGLLFLFQDNFGELINSDDRLEYLIKNKNVVLKSETPTNVKITVKYEGNKVPNLIGYRLNARTVCSAEMNSRLFFSGDLDNKAFLASLTSSKKASDYGEFEGCGTIPLLRDNELKNEKAQNGQWPWQAAIYIQNNNEERYVCEATLISPKHVVTAAHCVTFQTTELVVPAHQLTVYLGKHNRGDDNNAQTLRAEKILLYPGYVSSNLLNDIALIRLEKPVTINDYTRPICLKHSSDKKEGFLVGYGINRDHKIEDLAQAKVKIINEEECSKQHSDLKSLLTDNVFCASYVQDNSLCVGDSGSSLALLREGSRAVWELKGVVTVGVALQDKYLCNHSSTVFLVDVANYLKWIQEVIS